MIKVLLVDNDTVTNLVTIRLIKNVQKDTKIEICLNGTEAINLIENQAENELPDLIILDISCNRSWEFLHFLNEKLPKKNKKTVVQISSFSIDPEEHRKISGFLCIDGFSQKPLRKPLLVSLFEKCASQ